VSTEETVQNNEDVQVSAQVTGGLDAASVSIKKEVELKLKIFVLALFEFELSMR